VPFFAFARPGPPAEASRVLPGAGLCRAQRRQSQYPLVGPSLIRVNGFGQRPSTVNASHRRRCAERSPKPMRSTRSRTFATRQRRSANTTVRPATSKTNRSARRFACAPSARLANFSGIWRRRRAAGIAKRTANFTSGLTVRPLVIGLRPRLSPTWAYPSSNPPIGRSSRH
jgi:hypothetical protein